MKSTKELVLEWADKKGLLKEENHLKQTLKLTEEVGELSKAILEKNPYDTIDAIGDCVVVLTILANQLGFDIDECFRLAYEEIKDRTDKYKNNSQIALLEEESQALWEKIFELTKPYRKKGIIESELIPDSVKEKIKDAEERAGNIQKQIKSLMEGVSTEDKKKLKDLYKELENLFVTQETPQYYIDLQLAQATVKSEEGIEVATLDDDYMYAHSQWFRDNHIRTEVETQTGETYFKYKPAYYYRINKATDSTKNKLVPGKQYWSFTLPENPNYTDMFGRRTLKKTSSFYRPENYRKLESSTTKEGKVNFDTLKFLRERTENAQRDLHQVNQIGYAVPTSIQKLNGALKEQTIRNY